MNEKEFKSQICTTKEQSKRLLELGLKPETADCMYFAMSKSYHGTDIPTGDRRYNLVLFFQDEIPIMSKEEYEYIPAWSLHRLLLLCDVTTMFDDLINVIETLIKNGFFNKEYLKQ